MNNDQGVIYIVTGKDYVEMAAMSARSLKTYCPNLPVHIFTDCDAASYDCSTTLSICTIFLAASVRLAKWPV